MVRTQPQSIDPDIVDATPPSRVATGRALPRGLVRVWYDIAGADLRSLALLRIVLAAVVLVDLTGRVANLGVHYSDDGVLTRAVLNAQTNSWRWSLLTAYGSTLFVGVMFGIAFIAAIAMLLGTWTRPAALTVWILVFSIQMRNPLLASGADVLLRLLLLSCVLLPIAEVWSLDSRRRPPPAETRVASVATLGLFLQIAFMYWFTAALKTGETWREDGTALFYALNAGHVSTAIGQWLGGLPDLLEVLTRLALGLEIVAPILLFMPVRTAWFRTVAALAIMGFQLAILLTFNIGIFPWTSGLCMVCFLPPAFWAWIGARIPRLGFREASPRRSPTPTPGLVTIGTNLAATLMLALALLWNVASVTDVRVPDGVRETGYALGLNQSWNMFAPTPPWGTEWFVLSGRLANGEEIDLLPAIVHGDSDLRRPVSWERPASIATSLYGDKYWRKYFADIAEDGNGAERRMFLAWACRFWNTGHRGSEALVAVTMVDVFERTQRDGSPSPTVRRPVESMRCVTGASSPARLY